MDTELVCELEDDLLEDIEADILWEGVAVPVTDAVASCESDCVGDTICEFDGELDAPTESDCVYVPV